MKRIVNVAGGIWLAIGLACMGAAVAADDIGAGMSRGNVKFFLADPELGLAGVYRADGTEIYFEARRSLDAKSGAPGALSLRVIDAEARTIALAGKPHAEHWVPRRSEFSRKDGFAYADLLTALSEALDASDLHVALSAEKAALANLAAQAADTPAGRFPLQATLGAAKSATVDVSQVADFYLHSLQDLELDRKPDGVLEANLGNGIVMLSTQRFIANERDANGQIGRVDSYAMVKAADGYVLTAELGGDSMPKGWSNAMEIENKRGHDELATDFGRAATALNALAYSGKSTQGVTVSHRAEQATMQRLAQTLAIHLLPMREDAADASPAGSSGLQKSSGLYQTYIQVWRKPFVILAEHSGTRVGKRRYNSTTSYLFSFQGYVSFCNHGSCAATDGMTHKCSYVGPRMTWYRVPTRQWDAGGHTCATFYQAVGAGGHNCHDDSSTQVKAVRGQAYGTTSGRCSDWSSWSHAPTCDWQ